MKTYHKLFLILILLFAKAAAFAQTDDPKVLLKQGIALNDSGKYDQAIAKYEQAIKIDPNYQDAWYEKSYTLFTSGKEKQAIPSLEKVIQLNPSSAQAYDMLGSIYDDLKDSDKALNYYQLGIKADSTYQRLHFNLAITYYRLGKYAESEASAIKAIKLNPKHASSQRVYGMALYHQHKNAFAILAFCNFLLIEPQSDRSLTIYKYIDTIFKQQKDKNIVLTSVDFSGKELKPLTIAEMSVNLGVTTKDTLSKLGNTSGADQMMIQLKVVFNGVGGVSQKLGTNKDFFWKFYADYFYKLGQSDNMLAFARYITLSAFKDENLQWFKEHDTELKDFSKWISATDRNF